VLFSGPWQRNSDRSLFEIDCKLYEIAEFHGHFVFLEGLVSSKVAGSGDVRRDRHRCHLAETAMPKLDALQSSLLDQLDALNEARPIRADSRATGHGHRAHLASHAKIWIVREKRGAAVTCRLPCRRLRWWSPYGWAGLWRARSPRGLRCKRIGGGRAGATELNHRRGGQHGDGRASRDR